MLAYLRHVLFAYVQKDAINRATLNDTASMSNIESTAEASILRRRNSLTPLHPLPHP